MTPQFITLPSGLRVNTAHILSYVESDRPGKIMIIVGWEDGFGNKSICEDMTAEQFDALLSPTSSPIVESVVNLDNLKPGKACCFTYEGTTKHGTLDYLNFSAHGLVATITSDGETHVVPIPTISNCQ